MHRMRLGHHAQDGSVRGSDWSDVRPMCGRSRGDAAFGPSWKAYRPKLEGLAMGLVVREERLMWNR